MLGYHPPGAGTSPGADTPPGPGTPMGPGTPWEQTPPPGPDTTRGPGTPPPEQSMLGGTVNERAVRILLECILVDFMFSRGVSVLLIDIHAKTF